MRRGPKAYEAAHDLLDDHPYAANLAISIYEMTRSLNAKAVHMLEAATNPSLSGSISSSGGRANTNLVRTEEALAWLSEVSDQLSVMTGEVRRKKQEAQ